MITFLVYNPAKQSFARVLYAASRSASTYEMVPPPDWPDDLVHAWAFCTNAAGKISSDSRYIGSITIL